MGELCAAVLRGQCVVSHTHHSVLTTPNATHTHTHTPYNAHPAPTLQHQDMAYWAGRNLTPDTRTVTFSLAMDATTVQNGALKFWTYSGDGGVLYPHVPVAASRDEAHAVTVQVDEAKAPIETLCVNRGDVTIHDEWVVHGSGGNLSNGTRRTYVMAFRTADTVARERAAGFTHSCVEQQAGCAELASPPTLSLSHCALHTSLHPPPPLKKQPRRHSELGHL
jgi:ectoine hydroxylase-related dioxygenase (phytanoyl-CoA dioxygenase family)